MKCEKQKKAKTVIVIGSGLGGLCIAALLSIIGFLVIVFEKQKQAGGYAVKFKRKGKSGKIYDFDASLHQIGAVINTILGYILKLCGIYDELEFVRHPHLYEKIYANGKRLKVDNNNPDSLKNELLKKYPKEKFGICLWFFIQNRVGMECDRWDKALMGNKANFILFLLLAPLLIPTLLIGHAVSIKTLLNICSKNKNLHADLTQLHLYYGDSLDEKFAVMMIGNYGYSRGGNYIKGGGQKIAQALIRVIEKNNGRIITGTGIKKIIFSRNQAVGVTENDENHSADIIVYNGNPFSLYANLLKDWSCSQKELKKIKEKEIGTSLSQIYMALKEKVADTYPEHKDSYIVFLEIKDDFYKTMSVAFPENVDPGQAGIVLITFPDNYDRWDLSKAEYEKKKEAELKKIFSLLDKYLPDLENQIDVISFATPIDMARYTGNPKGAVYGFSQKTPGLFRSFGKLPKNLYTVGAWYNPGGGYEGVFRSAFYIFLKILRIYRMK
jgi:all-trans-retinol 13,14-reductase